MVGTKRIFSLICFMSAPFGWSTFSFGMEEKKKHPEDIKWDNHLQHPQEYDENYLETMKKYNKERYPTGASTRLEQVRMRLVCEKNDFLKEENLLLQVLVTNKDLEEENALLNEVIDLPIDRQLKEYNKRKYGTERNNRLNQLGVGLLQDQIEFLKKENILLQILITNKDLEEKNMLLNEVIDELQINDKKLENDLKEREVLHTSYQEFQNKWERWQEQNAAKERKQNTITSIIAVICLAVGYQQKVVPSLRTRARSIKKPGWQKRFLHFLAGDWRIYFLSKKAA